MASTTAVTPEWAAQDKGSQVLSVCWTVVALSSCFVAARLYVKGFMQRNLRIDDYLIVFSAICSLISVILATAAVQHGYGKHFPLLPMKDEEYVVRYVVFSFSMGVISFGVPKLAVVILVTRLLNPSKWHKYFLYFLGILTQLVVVGTIGILVGQCKPINALWDFSITEKKCLNVHTVIDYGIGAGAFSAFVDLYLAIYPAVVVSRLQLALRKKVGVSVALGVGSVSAFCAIYKSTCIDLLANPDFSYETSPLLLWTVIEGCAIIVGSSIPSLQPLMERAFKNISSKVGKSSKGRSRNKYSKDRSEDCIELAHTGNDTRPDSGEDGIRKGHQIKITYERRNSIPYDISVDQPSWKQGPDVEAGYGSR